MEGLPGRCGSFYAISRWISLKSLEIQEWCSPCCICSMRYILTLSAILALFSLVCLAETFTGKLVDASCANEQQSVNGCVPNSSTTHFAIAVAAGKVYRLNEDGNAKASQALKSRADRMADPSSPQLASDGVKARVTGTLEGGIIKVESIEVQ